VNNFGNSAKIEFVINFISQKQSRCWKTSMGIIKRLMVRQKRKSLVASFQKNSFLKKSSFAKASEDNRRVATTP